MFFPLRDESQTLLVGRAASAVHEQTPRDVRRAPRVRSIGPDGWHEPGIHRRSTRAQRASAAFHLSEVDQLA